MNNWKRNLLLILFSFVLSMLDLSFFAEFTFLNSSIISSFAVMLNMILLNSKKETRDGVGVFGLSTFFVFSLFSSVSLWLLFSLFLILPGVLMYLRLNYFRTPSLMLSIFIFALANFLFDLSLLIAYGGLGQEGVQSLISFVFMNTFVGVAIYFIALRLKNQKSFIKV